MPAGLPAQRSMVCVIECVYLCLCACLCVCGCETERDCVYASVFWTICLCGRVYFWKQIQAELLGFVRQRMK